MGLEEAPETKLARRIFAKHSLKVPIEIDILIKEYANLIYKDIPIEGIDGVSINIKVHGKTPTVLVNTSIPKTRQVFTLAHELGHIIIPWHFGTIVDEIYNQSYKEQYYSELEQEANRFAAELLMPKDWVLSNYLKNKEDLAELHAYIANKAGVSEQAAAIRLIQILPPNVVYSAEENGITLHSGKTTGTYGFTQESGNRFDSNFYPYIDHYSFHLAGLVFYHWWKLSSKIQIDTDDTRSWREILDDIAQSINPREGIEKFKKSINGIIACAHGEAKKKNDYCVESVVSAAIYRLRRSDLNDFVSHPDFEKFVKIRVKDFFKQQ